MIRHGARRGPRSGCVWTHCGVITSYSIHYTKLYDGALDQAQDHEALHLRIRRVDGLEDRWNAVWERDGVYHFDRTKTRDEIYSIDTPPPTVSGSYQVPANSSVFARNLVSR